MSYKLRFTVPQIEYIKKYANLTEREETLLDLKNSKNPPTVERIAEIMDMSFAIQALSAKYLVEHGNELSEKLIDVPREVDLDVARRKLSFLGKNIDVLTPEQEKYLHSYTL